MNKLELICYQIDRLQSLDDTLKILNESLTSYTEEKLKLIKELEESEDYHFVKHLLVPAEGLEDE